jgi:hypothetical protein
VEINSNASRAELSSVQGRMTSIWALNSRSSLEDRTVLGRLIDALLLDTKKDIELRRDIIQIIRKTKFGGGK